MKVATAGRTNSSDDHEGLVWKSVAPMRVAFPHPIKMAVFSSSLKQIALVFEEESPSFGNALIAWFCTEDSQNGLKFCASTYVHLKSNAKFLSDQCLVMHEERGMMLSSAFRTKDLKEESHSVSYVIQTQGSLITQQRLETEIRVHCLCLDLLLLIMGGDEGSVLLWEWQAAPQCRWEKSRHQLPSASSCGHHLATLYRLCLLREDSHSLKGERRLIGLGLEGTVLCWDLLRYHLLSAFCPMIIRIKDVCPVRMQRKTGQSEEIELGLLGIAVNLHKNSKHGMLTPLTISSNTLKLGSAFPIESVQKLHARDCYALGATEDGELFAWNLFQGTQLWGTKSDMLTSLAALSFDPHSKSVGAVTTDGQLFLWNLTD